MVRLFLNKMSMHFNIKIPLTEARVFNGNTTWERFALLPSIEVNKSLSAEVWFITFSLLKWFITIQFGKDSHKINQ